MVCLVVEMGLGVLVDRGFQSVRGYQDYLERLESLDFLANRESLEHLGYQEFLERHHFDLEFRGFRECLDFLGHRVCRESRGGLEFQLSLVCLEILENLEHRVDLEHH